MFVRACVRVDLWGVVIGLEKVRETSSTSRK